MISQSQYNLRQCKLLAHTVNNYIVVAVTIRRAIHRNSQQPVVALALSSDYLLIQQNWLAAESVSADVTIIYTCPRMKQS